MPLPFGVMVRSLLLAWSLLPFARAHARPEPLLLVNNVAPLIYREGGVTKGVLYELMRDMASRAGHSGRVEAVPAKRALLLVKTQSNVLGTVGRFTEIENSYSWLCKLIDDRILLVARAGSGVDISSVERAKHLRVGVILGGPAEALARRLGFTHIEAIVSPGSNARKLALGRIDAWITARGVAAHAQATMGDDMLGLSEGAVLAPISLYLAASRTFDHAEASRWQAACGAMRQDGSYARILRHYHYDVPK